MTIRAQTITQGCCGPQTSSGNSLRQNHMRKFPALFYEFEETGVNAALGYKNPGDLRGRLSHFFWKVVTPYIQDGLRYLRVTETEANSGSPICMRMSLLSWNTMQPWHL